MNRVYQAAISLIMVTLLSSPALAHFGMVIPSSPLADQQIRSIQIMFSFSHPFGMEGMDLVTPTSVMIYKNGQAEDVASLLKPAEVMGHAAFSLDYDIARPGVYMVAMEPAPYWEPAEDCHIIHYTKTIIPAFGSEEGWDETVGFPVEIKPLTRPFGNYAGGTFTGQVLVNGQPAAGVDVEVELYNSENRYAAPTPYHETMVVKTDENGVFTWSCPKPGWWGFAALVEGAETIPDPDGNPKGVELGGVLWTYFHAWSEQ